MTNNYSPLLLAISLSVGLVGCAGGNFTLDTEGFNLAELESIVKVNETTYDDLRALFRKPTVTGLTPNGEMIVVYSFRGIDTVYSSLESLAITFLSVGLAPITHPYTVKNAYFRLNKENRVVEIKKDGYAFLKKIVGAASDAPVSAFFGPQGWNECEVVLTDAEVNSPAYYSGRLDICSRYKAGVAQKTGVSPNDVDDSKEFPLCDVVCYAKRGAISAYGNVGAFVDDFDWQEGDGRRADETRILHNPIKRIEAIEN